MMTMTMEKQAQTALPMEPKQRSVWDEPLPYLSRRLKETLIEVRGMFVDEECCPDFMDSYEVNKAVQEIYVFLRKCATRTQACLIIRYPDLVWEYYDAYCNTDWGDPFAPLDPDEPDPFEEGVRGKVRELMREAVLRVRDNKQWWKYKERLRWVNVGRFRPAPSERGCGHYEAD